MKTIFILLVAGVLLAGVAMRAGRSVDSKPVGAPQFTAQGKLVRPEGFRRWVYLSSGYGMSYDQKESAGNKAFTNVFVNPTSYDYYVANGKWPDHTMFVLEIYGSTSQGSINKHGNYQTEFQGLDVEVKDEKRFADKWAYFPFNETEKESSAITPAQNACWKCHDQNAAVEHSFVQFYPELLKVAQAKGTIKPGTLEFKK